jgi:hypothetical protein
MQILIADYFLITRAQITTDYLTADQARKLYAETSAVPESLLHGNLKHGFEFWTLTADSKVRLVYCTVIPICPDQVPDHIRRCHEAPRGDPPLQPGDKSQDETGSRPTCGIHAQGQRFGRPLGQSRRGLRRRYVRGPSARRVRARTFSEPSRWASGDYGPLPNALTAVEAIPDLLGAGAHGAIRTRDTRFRSSSLLQDRLSSNPWPSKRQAPPRHCPLLTLIPRQFWHEPGTPRTALRRPVANWPPTPRDHSGRLPHSCRVRGLRPGSVNPSRTYRRGEANRSARG